MPSQAHDCTHVQVKEKKEWNIQDTRYAKELIKNKYVLFWKIVLITYVYEQNAGTLIYANEKNAEKIRRAQTERTGYQTLQKAPCLIGRVLVSLVRDTLCPWARHFILCLVFVQHRKCHDMTEMRWLGRKASYKKNWSKYLVNNKGFNSNMCIITLGIFPFSGKQKHFISICHAEHTLAMTNTRYARR